MKRLPKVSICLPNLNNRVFLEERLRSIYRQSFTDWELVIVDNHSEDGAFELLQEHAAKDSRIKLSQAPRQGMYANWNNTIRKAEGEYLYIATSDDTMADNCIEKLLEALERFPQAGLAHCLLKTEGVGSDEYQKWWETHSPFALTCPDGLYREHHRQPLLDFLLHGLGGSVYISMTQLMIRRTVFDAVGLFPNEFGSQGDFYWNCLATARFSTVHVPVTWGGWRLHPDQASASVLGNDYARQLRIRMFRKVLESGNTQLSDRQVKLVRAFLDSIEVKRALKHFFFGEFVLKQKGKLLLTCLRNPINTASCIRQRFLAKDQWGRSDVELLKIWMHKNALVFADNN